MCVLGGGAVIRDDNGGSLSAHTPVTILYKLIGLSAAMAGDAAFARQVRRKYL